MRVIEKVRPSAFTRTRPLRVKHTPKETAARADTVPLEEESEVTRLRRQLRRATERNSKAFDQGFAAAVDMVARGATLERLRDAAGIVSDEWRDTAPIEVPEIELDRALATLERDEHQFDEPTLVDAPPVPS